MGFLYDLKDDEGGEGRGGGDVAGAGEVLGCAEGECEVCFFSLIFFCCFYSFILTMSFFSPGSREPWVSFLALDPGGCSGLKFLEEEEEEGCFSKHRISAIGDLFLSVIDGLCDFLLFFFDPSFRFVSLNEIMTWIWIWTCTDFVIYSFRTAASLAKAADALVLGAKEGLFTPMYLMIAKKPE